MQRVDMGDIGEDILNRRAMAAGALRTRLEPDPMFGDEAEHYDLENASSIAPSDIDIVYHYKGYRRGGRSLPKKKKQVGS